MSLTLDQADPGSTLSKSGRSWAALLAPLRALVDEQPTYGYRRITVLMNREWLKMALPRLNQRI